MTLDEITYKINGWLRRFIIILVMAFRKSFVKDVFAKDGIIFI